MRGNHRDRVVLVMMAYRTGVRNEPVHGAGTAIVLEHLLARAPLPSLGRLADAPGAPGSSGSDVAHDLIYFWRAVDRDQLGLALQLEAERMTRAPLDEERFRTEVARCRKELAEAEENPVAQLWKAFFAAAFPVHPYGRPRRGLPGDLAALTLKGVTDFRSTFIHPDGATLIVLGDLPPDLTRQVEAAFGGIPRSPGIPVPVALEPPQREPRRVELRAPGAAPRLLLGFHLPAVDHPDHPVLLAAKSVLARRLQQLPDLEEVGRLVSVRAESPLHYRDPHLLILIAEATGPEALPGLERRMWSTVDGLASAPPTEEEMAAARAATLAEIAGPDELDPPPAGEGDFLARYYVEVALAYARRAPRAAYFDGPYADRLKDLSAARIRAVAAQYLVRPNSTVATLAPAEK